MVKLIANEIDPATVYRLINAEGSGSVVLHYAVVKPMTGPEGTTTCIDYGAGEDTEAELQQISDELMDSFALKDILLIRRSGRLGIGAIISLVAASSPNSDDAFEACRLGIARLKKMKSIVKREVRRC